MNLILSKTWNLFPCRLKQNPASRKEKWGFQLGALTYSLKVIPWLLMLRSSARTSQAVDHFQPLQHLTVSRILAPRLLLAAMIWLSQDGSEHEKITVHRNAEDDRTDNQSKDHLVPAKPFHPFALLISQSAIPSFLCQAQKPNAVPVRQVLISGQNKIVWDVISFQNYK
jgi:hypothetical protein